MWKEFREGRAAWEKIGERECEGPMGFGTSLTDDREGVQSE